MGIGETLKRLREEKGLSKSELAEAAGVSPAEVSRIESGEKLRPSPRILMKLATALEVPVEELYRAAGYLSLDLSRLPVGLRELVESPEGKLLNISEDELEVLAAVGARRGRLSKQAYIDILLDIRRDEGRSPFGG